MDTLRGFFEDALRDDAFPNDQNSIAESRKSSVTRVLEPVIRMDLAGQWH